MSEASKRPETSGPLSRRNFLQLSAASLVAAPVCALALPEQRQLSFVHTHVNESLSVTYFKDGDYVKSGLGQLDHLLRDFRTAAVHPIDPQLFDILYGLQVLAGRDTPFEIISGYRSPATNTMLRSRSGGVATRSLHMDGKAIDVRMTNFPTRKLRDLALSMRRGGVGFYSASDFVHLDTGRVRSW